MLLNAANTPITAQLILSQVNMDTPDTRKYNKNNVTINTSAV